MKNTRRIKRYLARAYQVFDGQKQLCLAARLPDSVVLKTDLPKKIFVNKAFYNHLAASHPEIGKNKLLGFVMALNIPDEIYHFPLKSKLNFFRVSSRGIVNIVGTSKKGERISSHQVVTSFFTDSLNYLSNIKKTAIAVYSRNTGGAPLDIPSSPKNVLVSSSPPAERASLKGISGVSDSVSSIP
ncbi:MAG: hypothetical protein AAB791_00400 [Patescibacteria group bacterium]